MILSDTFIAEKTGKGKILQVQENTENLAGLKLKRPFFEENKSFILIFLDAAFSRGDDGDDGDQTWQASELVTRQRWWLQIFQAPLCAAQWFIIERRQSSPLLTIARNIDLKKTPKSQKIFSHSFCSFTEALSWEKKTGQGFYSLEVISLC